MKSMIVAIAIQMVSVLLIIFFLPALGLDNPGLVFFMEAVSILQVYMVKKMMNAKCFRLAVERIEKGTYIIRPEDL